MSDAIKEQIMTQLDVLSDDKQTRILDLARTLAAAPAGTPGRNLLRFAGMFEVEDARRMAAAIEEGCERVDSDEW